MLSANAENAFNSGKSVFLFSYGLRMSVSFFFSPGSLTERTCSPFNPKVASFHPHTELIFQYGGYKSYENAHPKSLPVTYVVVLDVHTHEICVRGLDKKASSLKTGFRKLYNLTIRVISFSMSLRHLTGVSRAHVLSFSCIIFKCSSSKSLKLSFYCKDCHSD